MTEKSIDICMGTGITKFRMGVTPGGGKRRMDGEQTLTGLVMYYVLNWMVSTWMSVTLFFTPFCVSEYFIHLK